MKIYGREKNNNLSTCKVRRGKWHWLGNMLRKPFANAH